MKSSVSHVAVVASLLLGGCASNSQEVSQSQVPTPEQSRLEMVSMPPFTEEWASLASDFYKITWTNDGYPGKLQDDGSIWEHPIYPIYVLNDYLLQYQEKPTDELREALKVVSHAAVKRMQAHEGALVFWYEPGNGARLFKKHYSALTQGYYADTLWQVGELLEDESLLEASRKSFLALTIPHDKGGVLFRDKNGVSIAEVPQEPNSYILNGWQSALVSAWKYYELSGDPIAQDLVIESSKTMKKLLPLYDAPDGKNSRYGLTGFTYLRTTNSDLKNFSVSIPTEGEFYLTNYESRWANHRVNKRQVNLVVSKASYPDPIVVSIEVDSPTKVELFVGDYDPLSSSPVNEKWVEIGSVDSTSPTLVIPWELVDRIVYPTNFLKVIDGKNTNVYHSIHINRLAELQSITSDPEFGLWSDKWAGYLCSWNDLYPGLSNRSISTEQSGRKIQSCG
jgi:hypothetical protein